MTNAKYEAWLNGEALSNISPEIYISSIKATPPKATLKASEIANRPGQRLNSVRWKDATVTISFVTRKIAGHDRQAIVQDVYAWAASGGTLEISDRPGQQLHVICTSPPYITDTCDFTEPITVVFQTTDKPFWEEKQVTTTTLTAGTSGSGTIFVPGNAGKALVEVTATPADSSANLSFTVGSTTITLTGCNATSSNPLTITYDGNEIQSIKVGTTSVMDKRTGSDDLLAVCGASNTVSFTASASTAVTYSVRGLWM